MNSRLKISLQFLFKIGFKLHNVYKITQKDNKNAQK